RSGRRDRARGKPSSGGRGRWLGWDSGCRGALRPVASSSPDRRGDSQRGDHHEQPEQDAGRQTDAAEGQGDELDEAESDGDEHDDQGNDQKDAAHAREDSRGSGGNEQAHGPQGEELAPTRRRLSEALDGALEISGAAFGEGERCVGHAPYLHPLLRTRGGDGALEVAARSLCVESLGCARTEDRHRRGLVFGLGFELLIGALLEGLDGLEAAALLDAYLALFGSHELAFYGLRNRLRGSLGDWARGEPAGMLAACRALSVSPHVSWRVSCALCFYSRSPAPRHRWPWQPR